MLHRFPDVQGWAQTGDVLQSSLLRLLRALEEVRPASSRDFFGLAAEQMRRELLDLARHFNGPRGLAANYQSNVENTSEPRSRQVPLEVADDPGELERWERFHQAVEALPAEERETVGLISTTAGPRRRWRSCSR